MKVYGFSFIRDHSNHSDQKVKYEVYNTIMAWRLCKGLIEINQGLEGIAIFAP